MKGEKKVRKAGREEERDCKRRCDQVPWPQSSPASGSFQMSRLFADKILELQHQPSNECSGLISFRMDWLDLLAVQGTLKSLLQHHSSKASILWRSWQVPICSWQSKEMSRPGSKASRIPVVALGWVHFSFCFASSSDLLSTH